MWIKISQGIRSFFTCEKFPSLLYLLVFLPDILRSCDRSFFFLISSICKVSQKCRKCHRIKEKGTATKAKSLFAGTWKFSPKTLRTEKMY